MRKDGWVGLSIPNGFSHLCKRSLGMIPGGDVYTGRVQPVSIAPVPNLIKLAMGTGACNTANTPLNIINKMSQILLD